MKVLVDTNVLLDVLTRRPGLFMASARVWKAAEEHRFEAFVSAISFTNIHYILGKYSGQVIADQSVRLIHKAFQIAAVDSNAIASGNPDFEDAVQASSALHAGLTHVVTRDARKFTSSGLIVIAATDWKTLIV